MAVVPFQQQTPYQAEIIPPLETEDAHVALTPTLAAAVFVLTAKAKMTQSAAEAKDYMDAALKAAQAIITLDPNRLQGGDTPQARKDSLPDPPPKADGNKDGKIG